MRTPLLVLVGLCVFAAPLSADVITARRTAKPDHAKVADRVTALGVPQAGSEVAAMTDADRAFFAAAPERVQVAAAQQDAFSGQVTPLTYEFILGGVMAVLGGATVLYMIRNNED
jgi:hypothetical protein